MDDMEKDYLDGSETSAEETGTDEYTEDRETSGAEEESSSLSTAQETKEEVKETAEEQEEKKIRLKYLGQEYDLTEEQVVALAQKGANYDRLTQKLNSFQQRYEGADDLLEILDSYAQTAGMDRRQYAQYLRQSAKEQQIQALVEQGNTEQAAREIVELREKARTLEGQTAQTRRAQEAQTKEQARLHDMMSRFVQAFPDVKEFPPEVHEKLRRGEDAVVAYQSYLISQLEQEKQEAAKAGQQKAVAQLTAAAKSSPGALSGGDSKPLNIEDMSDAEFEKLLQKAKDGELRHL